MATSVEIFDKAACISPSNNTLGKSMNSMILTQTMGRLFGKTGHFHFVMATGLEKGFKPVKLRLSYLAHAVRFSKPTRYIILKEKSIRRK